MCVHHSTLRGGVNICQCYHDVVLGVTSICISPRYARLLSSSRLCCMSCLLSCRWSVVVLVSVNVDVDKGAVASHGVAEKDHVYCRYDGDHEDVEDDGYGADGPD